MSDTPRTDAEEFDWTTTCRGEDVQPSRPAIVVEANFARQLERALAAAREELGRYKAFIDWMDLYGATITTVADERGSLRLDWYRGTAFGNSMGELMTALDAALDAGKGDKA